MKGSAYALMLFANFLFSCGPQSEPGWKYFKDFQPEEAKTSAEELLAFEQIRAPNIDEKKIAKVHEIDIEQWRLGPHFIKFWSKLTPWQTYYYDWLNLRKLNKRRVYPW
jgi:hypothetical protein